MIYELVINHKSEIINLLILLDTNKEQKVVKLPLNRSNFIFYAHKSGKYRDTGFSRLPGNPDVQPLPIDPS